MDTVLLECQTKNHYADEDSVKFSYKHRALQN